MSFDWSKFLKRAEAVVLGGAISYAIAHKADAVNIVEAAAASAPGSPSQTNVNAAVERIFPAIVRPLVDAELRAQEEQLVAALAQGAPAFVDKVIAIAQAEQAKLAA